MRIEQDPWKYGRYMVLNSEGKEVGSYILCKGQFCSKIGTDVLHPQSGPCGSVISDRDTRREGVYDSEKLKKLEQKLMKEII